MAEKRALNPLCFLLLQMQSLGYTKETCAIWGSGNQIQVHDMFRGRRVYTHVYMHTPEALRNLAVSVCHTMPLWFVCPFWEPAMGTKRHFASICPPYEPEKESQKLYKWRWHEYLCTRHLPRSFLLPFPQASPRAAFWSHMLQFSLPMTAQTISPRILQSQGTFHAIVDD